ncbi:MAG: nodulation protein NfeD [Acidobacteriota bacterium]|jgi:membrane-bound serine protease (ClpP class)
MRPSIVLGVLLAVLSTPAAAAVRFAPLRQPIHGVSAEYLHRVLAAADAAGDPLVVIELDTPGGLSDSMKEIIQDVIHARTPVCVFVAPSGARAASAGFLILLSADVAAMAPGTNTGSAHPVFTGEEVIEEGKRHLMMEKVENDAAAFARTLAENRGRNVDLAERAVRESLNFTETEALDQGLVDLVVDDRDDLLAALDGMEIRRFDGATQVLDLAGTGTTVTEMNWRERFLGTLANPALSFLLLALGGLGLYAEFQHPGMVVPGVVGAIALLLFGFSAQVLPINWVGVLFLAIAGLMFVLEVKVTSYGALTVGGIVCLFLGGLMLYDTPDIPELRVPTGLLAAISVAVGGVVAVLVGLVVRAHRGRVETGEEGLVGEIGTAITDLGPAGRVFVHGEYWDAVSSDPLGVGESVRVVGVEGLRLRVEKA